MSGFGRARSSHAQRLEARTEEDKTTNDHSVLDYAYSEDLGMHAA